MACSRRAFTHAIKIATLAPGSLKPKYVTRQPNGVCHGVVVGKARRTVAHNRRNWSEGKTQVPKLVPARLTSHVAVDHGCRPTLPPTKRRRVLQLLVDAGLDLCEVVAGLADGGENLEWTMFMAGRVLQGRAGPTAPPPPSQRLFPFPS